MEYLNNLLVIMLGAVLLNNFIFSKFMGICPFLGVSEKPSTAAGMGFAVVFVITAASALTWTVNEFVLVRYNLEYLRTVAFILLIAALVQLIEMYLKKFVPALYGALGIYLPLITTNCAVLGAALLNIQSGYDFVESVVFGFSAAVGFLMAIMIFAGVRARMRFADVPAPFRGVPITLIAAGLVAMAFSGFSGIKIG